MENDSTETLLAEHMFEEKRIKIILKNTIDDGYLWILI